MTRRHMPFVRLLRTAASALFSTGLIVLVIIPLLAFNLLVVSAKTSAILKRTLEPPATPWMEYSDNRFQMYWATQHTPLQHEIYVVRSFNESSRYGINERLLFASMEPPHPDVTLRRLLRTIHFAGGNNPEYHRDKVRMYERRCAHLYFYDSPGVLYQNMQSTFTYRGTFSGYFSEDGPPLKSYPTSYEQVTRR